MTLNNWHILLFNSLDFRIFFLFQYCPFQPINYLLCFHSANHHPMGPIACNIKKSIPYCNISFFPFVQFITRKKYKFFFITTQISIGQKSAFVGIFIFIFLALLCSFVVRQKIIGLLCVVMLFKLPLIYIISIL